MNIDLYNFESVILQLFPWVLLFIWTIYVLFALSFKNHKSNLFSFHIIQNIPSIFVTLGVLGTFAGVTFGLLKFNLNPEQIAQSIDGLLSGLKNAFFTSLYGLFASVISNVIIRFKYSKKTLQDPEIQEEIELIHELKQSIDDFGKNLAEYNSEAIMSSLRKVITDFNDTFSTLIGELVTDNFQKLSSSVDQLVEWQRDYREGIGNVLSTNKELNIRSEELFNSFEKIHLSMNHIKDSSNNLKNALNGLRSSIEDESSLSGLITQLEKATDNLVEVSEEADLFKNEIERIASHMVETQQSVQGWLRREDGVLDAANSLNHTLTELREFDISQIERLDESFNERLGTTFQSLDKLMKSYIKYLEDRNKN